MAANNYSFEYKSKRYQWDRNTLRSPEGRAEIQRVLRERVKELSYLGYTAGYEVMKDMTTAKNVIQALGGNVTEPLLRTIETDIIEKMSAAPQEETEVATQPTKETAAPTAPGLEAVRGMNEIAKTAEGRIALQRWRNGQDLDAAQSRLVDRYRHLEKEHNDAADAARPKGAGGWMPTTRPHSIPADLYRIEKIGDVRERVHAIRELKSQWRDDKASPFNDINHPEHKNYIGAMDRLYRAEAELGGQPEDE